MRVVHLSISDADWGGAIAAYRLQRGLRCLGFNSTMFVSNRLTDDPNVMVFQPPRDLGSRLRRRLRRMQITRSFARYRTLSPDIHGWFIDDRSPHGAEVLAQLPPCDVLHLHATGSFVDYQAFFTAVPQHTPVVQTLHDMSFFTGGCQYDRDCGKYTEQCGVCPQLGSRREQDLSRHVWQRKHAAFSTVPPGRLYPVAPSRWMANEAKRSTLLQNFPVTVIPLGLDTEVFRPRDRSFAREVLGVPQDASVVLFVADPITRLLKGFALLAQALNGLGDLPNLFLISVGSGKPPIEAQVPHLRLSQIGNQRLLSLVYSAADIFVIPSLQDNFPQVALEATACGTPVIGFAVGGITDIVRPGITGLLVPPQDVTALRAAIGDLLQDPTRRVEMAANCRRLAVEEYTLEVQAQRYIELYQKILADY